jgi:hypothetical protein
MQMQADCTDSCRAETQHKTSGESTPGAIVSEAKTEPASGSRDASGVRDLHLKAERDTRYPGRESETERESA